MHEQIRNMPNRIIAPHINKIGAVRLHQPIELSFQNGLRVFIFQAPQQEMIKAEFVFNHLYQTPENSTRNTALSSMLKEGTSTKSSAEIAEAIDFYGAYLIPEFSFDHQARSEEHTSELQSRENIVCRLLLEKK